MIYLDYAATTFVRDEIKESYIKFINEYFANPDSLHKIGQESSKYLMLARKQIASLLNVRDDEVIFTSGASESNNLAIKGIALQYKNRGNHIISTRIEHPSVLNTLQQMKDYYGCEVDFVDVDSEGNVDIKQLESLIRESTILVTMQHVNSETGAIIDVEKIGAFLKKYPKLFFHVDATQSMGKIKFDTKNIDLISFSGHKLFSLKGTGCLIKKENVMLQPLICGGQQENGFRAGTSNVGGDMMLAKALRLALDEQTKNYEYVRGLYNYLEKEIGGLDNVLINSTNKGSPYVFSFSMLNMKPEVVLNYLSARDIYVSTKSACSSKKNTPSYVINEFFKDEKRATTTIRVSMSRYNTIDELKEFVRVLKESLASLKEAK